MAERARAVKRALLVGGLAGLMAAAVVAVVRRAPDVAVISWPVPGEEGPHIEVEVLNGTAVDGLARAVTTQLRRSGLDVVYFGTTGQTEDATRLLIRRGDSAAALAVQGALGYGRIELAPDPRLLLDVSVILGLDARVVRGDP